MAIYKGQNTENRYPGASKKNPACIDASQVNRHSTGPKQSSRKTVDPKNLAHSIKHKLEG